MFRLLCELQVLEQLECSSHFVHLYCNILFKIMYCENIPTMVFNNAFGIGITHESVATTNVEVNIRQRVKAEVICKWLHINHSYHFKEQTQLGYFRSLCHNIHTVKIAENNRLVDEIMDIRAVLALYLVKCFLCIRRFSFNAFKPCDAIIVKRFENVHCRKEERSRTTSRVKDCHRAQSVIEVIDERLRCIIGIDKVCCKLSNVKVIGDKIVDGRNITITNLIQYILTSLQTFNGFAPDFCRQGERFRSFRVPIFTAFQKLRLGRVKPDGNILRDTLTPIRGITLLHRIIDVAVAALLELAPYPTTGSQKFLHRF